MRGTDTELWNRYYECRRCGSRQFTDGFLAECNDCGGWLRNIAVARE